jgi:hypothetical protein
MFKAGFKVALVAALPIEAINFWVIGYPVAGNALTTANQIPAFALEWYLFHLPGLIAIDRIQLIREHAHACSFVFFLAGYIDTAILLVAVIAAVRLVLHTLRKLSSPMKHAH